MVIKTIFGVAKKGFGLLGKLELNIKCYEEPLLVLTVLNMVKEVQILNR